MQFDMQLEWPDLVVIGVFLVLCVGLSLAAGILQRGRRKLSKRFLSRRPPKARAGANILEALLGERRGQR